MADTSISSDAKRPDCDLTAMVPNNHLQLFSDEASTHLLSQLDLVTQFFMGWFPKVSLKGIHRCDDHLMVELGSAKDRDAVVLLTKQKPLLSIHNGHVGLWSIHDGSKSKDSQDPPIVQGRLFLVYLQASGDSVELLNKPLLIYAKIKQWILSAKLAIEFKYALPSNSNLSIILLKSADDQRQLLKTAKRRDFAVFFNGKRETWSLSMEQPSDFEYVPQKTSQGTRNPATTPWKVYVWCSDSLLQNKKFFIDAFIRWMDPNELFPICDIDFQPSVCVLTFLLEQHRKSLLLRAQTKTLQLHLNGESYTCTMTKKQSKTGAPSNSFYPKSSDGPIACDFNPAEKSFGTKKLSLDPSNTDCSEVKDTIEAIFTPKNEVKSQMRPHSNYRDSDLILNDELSGDSDSESCIWISECPIVDYDVSEIRSASSLMPTSQAPQESQPTKNQVDCPSSHLPAKEIPAKPECHNSTSNLIYIFCETRLLVEQPYLSADYVRVLFEDWMNPYRNFPLLEFKWNQKNVCIIAKVQTEKQRDRLLLHAQTKPFIICQEGLTYTYKLMKEPPCKISKSSTPSIGNQFLPAEQLLNKLSLSENHDSSSDMIYIYCKTHLESLKTPLQVHIFVQDARQSFINWLGPYKIFPLVEFKWEWNYHCLIARVQTKKQRDRLLLHSQTKPFVVCQKDITYTHKLMKDPPCVHPLTEASQNNTPSPVEDKTNRHEKTSLFVNAPTENLANALSDPERYDHTSYEINIFLNAYIERSLQDDVFINDARQSFENWMRPFADFPLLELQWDTGNNCLVAKVATEEQRDSLLICQLSKPFTYEGAASELIIKPNFAFALAVVANGPSAEILKNRYVLRAAAAIWIRPKKIFFTIEYCANSPYFLLKCERQSDKVYLLNMSTKKQFRVFFNGTFEKWDVLSEPPLFCPPLEEALILEYPFNNLKQESQLHILSQDVWIPEEIFIDTFVTWMLPDHWYPICDIQFRVSESYCVITLQSKKQRDNLIKHSNTKNLELNMYRKLVIFNLSAKPISEVDKSMIASEENQSTLKEDIGEQNVLQGIAPSALESYDFTEKKPCEEDQFDKNQITDPKVPSEASSCTEDSNLKNSSRSFGNKTPIPSSFLSQIPIGYEGRLFFVAYGPSAVILENPYVLRAAVLFWLAPKLLISFSIESAIDAGFFVMNLSLKSTEAFLLRYSEKKPFRVFFEGKYYHWKVLNNTAEICTIPYDSENCKLSSTISKKTVSLAEDQLYILPEEVIIPEELFIDTFVTWMLPDHPYPICDIRFGVSNSYCVITLQSKKQRDNLIKHSNTKNLELIVGGKPIIFFPAANPDIEFVQISNCFDYNADQSNNYISSYEFEHYSQNYDSPKSKFYLIYKMPIRGLPFINDPDFVSNAEKHFKDWMSPHSMSLLFIFGWGENSNNLQAKLINDKLIDQLIFYQLSNPFIYASNSFELLREPTFAHSLAIVANGPSVEMLKKHFFLRAAALFWMNPNHFVSFEIECPANSNYFLLKCMHQSDKEHLLNLSMKKSFCVVYNGASVKWDVLNSAPQICSSLNTIPECPSKSPKPETSSIERKLIIMMPGFIIPEAVVLDTFMSWMLPKHPYPICDIHFDSRDFFFVLTFENSKQLHEICVDASQEFCFHHDNVICLSCSSQYYYSKSSSSTTLQSNYRGELLYSSNNCNGQRNSKIRLETMSYCKNASSLSSLDIKFLLESECEGHDNQDSYLEDENILPVTIYICCKVPLKSKNPLQDYTLEDSAYESFKDWMEGIIPRLDFALNNFKWDWNAYCLTAQVRNTNIMYQLLLYQSKKKFVHCGIEYELMFEPNFKFSLAIVANGPSHEMLENAYVLRAVTLLWMNPIDDMPFRIYRPGNSSYFLLGCVHLSDKEFLLRLSMEKPFRVFFNGSFVEWDVLSEPPTSCLSFSTNSNPEPASESSEPEVSLAQRTLIIKSKNFGFCNSKVPRELFIHAFVSWMLPDHSYPICDIQFEVSGSYCAITFQSGTQRDNLMIYSRTKILTLQLSGRLVKYEINVPTCDLEYIFKEFMHSFSGAISFLSDFFTSIIELSRIFGLSQSPEPNVQHSQRNGIRTVRASDPQSEPSCVAGIASTITQCQTEQMPCKKATLDENNIYPSEDNSCYEKLDLRDTDARKKSAIPLNVASDSDLSSNCLPISAETEHEQNFTKEEMDEMIRRELNEEFQLLKSERQTSDKEYKLNQNDICPSGDHPCAEKLNSKGICIKNETPDPASPSSVASGQFPIDAGEKSLPLNVASDSDLSSNCLPISAETEHKQHYTKEEIDEMIWRELTEEFELLKSERQTTDKEYKLNQNDIYPSDGHPCAEKPNSKGICIKNKSPDPTSQLPPEVNIGKDNFVPPQPTSNAESTLECTHRCQENDGTLNFCGSLSKSRGAIVYIDKKIRSRPILFTNEDNFVKYARKCFEEWRGQLRLYPLVEFKWDENRLCLIAKVETEMERDMLLSHQVNTPFYISNVAYELMLESNFAFSLVIVANGPSAEMLKNPCLILALTLFWMNPIVNISFRISCPQNATYFLLKCAHQRDKERLLSLSMEKPFYVCFNASFIKWEVLNEPPLFCSPFKATPNPDCPLETPKTESIVESQLFIWTDDMAFAHAFVLNSLFIHTFMSWMLPDHPYPICDIQFEVSESYCVITFQTKKQRDDLIAYSNTKSLELEVFDSTMYFTLLSEPYVPFWRRMRVQTMRSCDAHSEPSCVAGIANTITQCQTEQMPCKTATLDENNVYLSEDSEDQSSHQLLLLLDDASTHFLCQWDLVTRFFTGWFPKISLKKINRCHYHFKVELGSAKDRDAVVLQAKQKPLLSIHNDHVAQWAICDNPDRMYAQDPPIVQGRLFLVYLQASGDSVELLNKPLLIYAKIKQWILSAKLAIEFKYALPSNSNVCIIFLESSEDQTRLLEAAKHKDFTVFINRKRVTWSFSMKQPSDFKYVPNKTSPSIRNSATATTNLYVWCSDSLLQNTKFFIDAFIRWMDPNELFPICDIDFQPSVCVLTFLLERHRKSLLLRAQTKKLQLHLNGESYTCTMTNEQFRNEKKTQEKRRVEKRSQERRAPSLEFNIRYRYVF